MDHADVSSDKIIEIGVGSGFTSDYLTKKGFSITTIDIDENKNPDIVADITACSLPKADIYVGFEVFEHIPLEEAKKVWMDLRDIGVSKLILSLPYSYKTYLWLEMTMPLLGQKNIHIGRKRKTILGKHHFWELGIDGVSVRKMDEWLKTSGYKISKTYRYRNHQFFVAQLIK